MEKLDAINSKISEFFKDIVAFVQKVWEYIETFFTAKDKLWAGQNADEETTA
jgi:hypothetical protein